MNLHPILRLSVAICLACVATARAEDLDTPEAWTEALRGSSVSASIVLPMRGDNTSQSAYTNSDSTEYKNFSPQGTRGIGGSMSTKRKCDVRTTAKIPIRFAPNSARILMDRNSDRKLNALAGALGGVLANSTIVIAGHTDAYGDDITNLRLSKKRAAAVLRYLVNEYGVEGDNLTARGYGENCPIADNNDPSGRKLNRRVEFAILRRN